MYVFAKDKQQPLLCMSCSLPSCRCHQLISRKCSITFYVYKMLIWRW